jgi:hypothetical protein
MQPCSQKQLDCYQIEHLEGHCFDLAAKVVPNQNPFHSIEYQNLDSVGDPVQYHHWHFDSGEESHQQRLAVMIAQQRSGYQIENLLDYLVTVKMS